MRVVVVGASLGGVRTVQGLHRRAPDAQVVLVAGEPGAPDGIAVDRPPLSKSVLAGATVEPAPLVSPGELLAEVVPGRAVDLDTGARRVTLRGGRSLDYDHLVVATGSSPRLLPGLEPRPGVFVLRSAADSLALRAACSPGARVVVVGGGFIGTEVAWTLHGAGHPVTVVEPLPALMVRGLGPVLGAALTRRHLGAGIDVRVGAGVAAIEGCNRVEGVRLVDGTLLAADVVVLGLGTEPETAWLRGSGLQLRDGVVCDEHLAARGVNGVWAVGDVARWLNPRYGEDLRVEHWTNAVEGAGVVAAGIAGEPVVHAAVPYVWTEQLGGRLQVIGRVRPQDEMRVVHGELDAAHDAAFVAITGGAGRLQSVTGLGAVKVLMGYRRLLAAGATWEEALAA